MKNQAQDYLHPFVNYLKSRIESLLTLIQFEEGGKVVEPDGFRLKNLSAWSFEKYNSVFDSLGSFSSYCNLHCKFCYEEGNPVTYEKTRLSFQEAKTRIRYYRKKSQSGLPIFKTRLYKEPFTNKDLLTILKMVRASDPEVELYLTTNGSLLTEKILEQLSQLAPVNLCISLNSSDPEGRMRITGDKRSENSIRMCEKFRQYNVPFIGSIVAWPEIKESELIETIHFLDKNLARMIRITLPGFSKFYSKTSPFKTKKVWDEVLEKVLPLRKVVKTPILVSPSLYHSQALLPEVAGVIRESPASHAGIQFGDIIKSINGKKILSRVEAKKSLLSNKRKVLKIELERRKRTFSVKLQEREGSVDYYPYRPPWYKASKSNPFGIVLIDDFNPAWLWQVLKQVSEVPKRNVLLLTSIIMKPTVQSLLESLPGLDSLLGDKKLYLWVPKNRFWGGNIIMGDLYTCSDYLNAVYDFQKKHGIKPDLIIIPSSFSVNNNTDLLGVPYSSIEYATGIPVELARCSAITI